MALRPFNSVSGISVGNNYDVIDANGNVTSNSLTVASLANLGTISNVTITGGSAGQIIATDGNGNLSFITTTANSAAPMPYYVPAGESFIVPVNFQGLFAQPIEIDGVLQVNGSLIEVISIHNSNVTEIVFNDGNGYTSNAGFTFGQASGNLNIPGNVIVSTGNIIVGNTNISNTTVTANYLVSTTGCVAVGLGEIVVNNSTSNANIFAANIGNINIGLVANVVLGSASGNVTVQNNLIANGTVTAANVAVSNLYSKRTPINVTTSTVVDQFPATTYRSAKYTIKVGDNTGYQAIEVLLVHDSINSIITIYGSLSTTGIDLVSLNSTITSGNVQLLATGLNAGTSLNLMGTYVPD